jgi:hypothetical protein
MYELQQSNNEMSRGVRRPGAASFAVGALVGAGIALLLAPTDGKDVRRRLGDTARRVGTGAKGVIGRTRETVNGVKRDAQTAMERGREAFAQTRRPEGAGWRAQTP